MLKRPQEKIKRDDRSVLTAIDKANGNRIQIVEGSVKQFIPSKEDRKKSRYKRVFSFLERLELIFNQNYGWFFTNGMKDQKKSKIQVD